ncbi:MAG: hypothetical protein JXM79_25490 [Sedimentisphaerales bacterium]|nr:hypothetical protein [Sedimentisphaerales bacterium]
MKTDYVKHILRSLLIGTVLMSTGCQVSREIVDLTAPADQPRLEKLEEHLTYQDPDAGKPTYRRDIEDQ